LYESRFLSDEGRLFFDSADGLVSGDVNGQWDVYEFEPEGVGGCSRGVSGTDVVFVGVVEGSSVDGCVGLISGGQSASESVFLDAGGRGAGGQEGEDVFFLTAARLTSTDVDEAFDVYDAHECSAISPCLSASASSSGSGEACGSVEGCRSGGSSSAGGVFEAPASAATGPSGNLAPAVPVAVVKKRLSVAQVRAQDLAKALRVCRGKRNKRRRLVCEAQARKRYGPARKASRASGKASGRFSRVGGGL
jgi:hypothetical protein